MTDIQAAVGIEQLKKMPVILEKRRALAACYLDELKDVKGITMMRPEKNIRPNWQSFPLLVNEEACIHRDEVMQKMLDQGISTRGGVMNAHQEVPYKNEIWQLPYSEEARNQTLLIPLYHGISEDDQQKIIRVLKDIFIVSDEYYSDTTGRGLERVQAPFPRGDREQSERQRGESPYGQGSAEQSESYLDES